MEKGLYLKFDSEEYAFQIRNGKAEKKSRNEIIFIVENSDQNQVLQDGLSVAIEVTGIIMRENGQKKRVSIGYSIVPIVGQKIEQQVKEFRQRFNQIGQDAFFFDYKKNLISGSLRDYFYEFYNQKLSLQANKSAVSFNQPAIIDITIQEASCDVNLLQYLPVLTLIGTDDVIPGFQNQSSINYLHGQGKIDAKLNPSQDLYISDINIVNLRYLKHYFDIFIGNQAKILSFDDKLRRSPSIEKIYLKIMGHNTWKQINFNKKDQLLKVKGQPKEIKDQPKETKDLPLEIILQLDKKYEKQYYKSLDNANQQISQILTDKNIALVCQLYIQVKFDYLSDKLLKLDYLISECIYLPFNQDGLILDQEKQFIMRFSPNLSILDNQKIVEFGYFAPMINEEVMLIFQQSAKEQKKPKEHSYWLNVKKKFIPNVEVELDKKSKSQLPQPKIKDLNNLLGQENKDIKLNQDIKIKKDKGNEITIEDQKANQVPIAQENDHQLHSEYSQQDVDETASQYSEFLLCKEDNQNQNVDFLIDELSRDLAERLDEDPSIITQNSYMKTILQRFLDYSTLQEQQMGLSFSSTKNIQTLLGSLPPDRLKFILEFLVCLVLKNFKTNKLVPNLKSRESLLLELLNFDPNYKSALKLLISQRLSEEDKYNLLKLGIGQEVLDEQYFNVSPNQGAQNLREYNQFKVQFHFIAYKSPKIIDQRQINWPKQVAFRFQFFNFQTIQTFDGILKKPQIIGTDTVLHNFTKIEANSLYLLKKGRNIKTMYSSLENNDEIIEQFLIKDDPNNGLENLNQHFIDYLTQKSLTIETYDMTSQFLFGISKIDLSQFILQNESAFVSKIIEIDVCDANNGQQLGSLQLNIQNIASYIDEQNGLDQEQLDIMTSKYSRFLENTGSPTKSAFNETLNQTSQIKQSKHKKKLYSKPLEQIDTNFIQSTTKFEASSNINQSEELRKKTRVERLKFARQQQSQTQTSQKNSDKSPFVSLFYNKNQDQNRIDQKSTLSRIEIIRQTQKQDPNYLLQKALYNGVDFKLTLDAMPGLPQYFDMIIQNTFANQELFKIVIYDKDQDLFDESELQVVKNYDKKLELLVKQEKAIKPQSFDIISEKDDFILEPNQSTPITFQFLTFRPVGKIHQQREVNNNEGGLKYELRPRKIMIKIITRSEEQVCNMELLIQPRQNHVDHFLKFYMPADGSLQELQLQNFIPETLYTDVTNLTLKTSTRKFKAKFSQPDFKSINLYYKASKIADRMLSTQIYAYCDKYCMKLISLAQIDIFFLDAYHVKLPIGREIQFQLSYTPKHNANIQIFSSNPQLATHIQNYNFQRSLSNTSQDFNADDNLLNFQKGVKAIIPLNIKALEPGINKCVINGVDVTQPSQRHLMKAWLVEIEGMQAFVKDHYDLTLLRDTHSLQKIEFTNVFTKNFDSPDVSNTQGVKIQFTSSKPHIMQILGLDESSCLTMKQMEKKEIEIQFNAYRGKRSQETIMLFINEKDGDILSSDRINETIRFDIKFI